MPRSQAKLGDPSCRTGIPISHICRGDAPNVQSACSSTLPTQCRHLASMSSGLPPSRVVHVFAALAAHVSHWPSASACCACLWRRCLDPCSPGRRLPESSLSKVSRAGALRARLRIGSLPWSPSSSSSLKVRKVLCTLHPLPSAGRLLASSPSLPGSHRLRGCHSRSVWVP